MSDENSFLNLMVELGPSYDDVAMIQRSDYGQFTIVFVDDDIIDVNYDESDGKITLLTHVGALADLNLDENEDAETELCKLLLTYNYLWQETSGIRMALDDNDGNIVMLLDIVATGLELPAFAGILNQFRSTAAVWGDSILGERVPAAVGSEISEIGGLRV